MPCMRLGACVRVHSDRSVGVRVRVAERGRYVDCLVGEAVVARGTRPVGVDVRA